MPASATTSSGCAWRSALWNGQDPILKERLFGLTNGEGNHGEDVKELYYYLDATPTHSYLKYALQVPAARVPLRPAGRGESPARQATRREFELLDTGIFDDDRYFDVMVEYAKAGPEDILMRVTAHNRGPEAATLHLLPQLWFRNIWTWRENAVRPGMSVAADGSITTRHQAPRHLPPVRSTETRELLFTENETNLQRLFGVDGGPGPFKDAFHAYLVDGRHDAVDAGRTGTKAAAHYRLDIPAGGAAQIRLRLRKGPTTAAFDDFDEILAQRAGRGRRVLRRSADRPRRPGRPQRPAPGARRHDLEQAVLSLRRAEVAGTATRRSRRRRPSAAAAATATGSTSTTPTSSRCRTSGSIPGTPPGISPFTAFRSP